MFGGVFGASEVSKKLNNKMYCLAVGNGASHRWKELKAGGKPPEGRFHHAMHFYEKGNYLIVFGGRRFVNPTAEYPNESEFVTQICLLRLDSVEWYELKYKHQNQAVPGLYSFASALVDDDIIIFGGMTTDYTCNKALYSINLPDTRTAYDPAKWTKIS